MSRWKTVGVKKFALEKIPKRDEIKDILASYPWLEGSAIAMLTRYPNVTRELGKGAFGSAFLMEDDSRMRYVLKVEFGDLQEFPLWEAMVGAYLFAPQKDLAWRKENRVPLARPQALLLPGQKSEIKGGDPFLHVADYYGVVAVNHSELENFAIGVSKKAGEGKTFLERNWGTILNRAQDYLLLGLTKTGKKVWQATPFAKEHPMIFSVMEYFEEGNIADFLIDGGGSGLEFSEKIYLMRVAFFQVSETLKVLSGKLGFAHGDTHTGNVFVRKIPASAYSKMWYRTDDPTQSYILARAPAGGVAFALGDLGLNELHDYPEKPHFLVPIRSPRHDLHWLSLSFLMVASKLVEEIAEPTFDFVELARDLEGFMVTADEYDALVPTGGPIYKKERVKSLLRAAPRIDIHLAKGGDLDARAKEYAVALAGFSRWPESRSFDVDLGNVSEEIYERQKRMTEKIAVLVGTPQVDFEAPEKTGKEFWKRVGQSAGEAGGDEALEF